MKLDGRALVEIVRILQDGLIMGEDVSEKLRQLDLVESHVGTLTLSQEYIQNQEFDSREKS